MITTPKKPLISVVMPVYNAEKFVTKAIESVLNQTYENFEFIIINDGSSDKTPEIIQTYKNRDERIVVLTNVNNRGIYISRNLGLDAAQGKYIAVMDADDICLDERFEKQVTFLESQKGVMVLGTNINIIDLNDEFVREKKFPQTSNLIRWGLIFRCPIAHPTVMMRSNLFREVGYSYRNFSPAEDYDL